MTSNGEFFKIVNEKLTKVPAPENLTEYTYYKNISDDKKKSTIIPISNIR